MQVVELADGDARKMQLKQRSMFRNIILIIMFSITGCVPKSRQQPSLPDRKESWTDFRTIGSIPGELRPFLTSVWEKKDTQALLKLSGSSLEGYDYRIMYVSFFVKAGYDAKTGNFILSESTSESSAAITCFGIGDSISIISNRTPYFGEQVDRWSLFSNSGNDQALYSLKVPLSVITKMQYEWRVRELGEHGPIRVGSADGSLIYLLRVVTKLGHLDFFNINVEPVRGSPPDRDLEPWNLVGDLYEEAWSEAEKPARSSDLSQPPK